MRPRRTTQQETAAIARRRLDLLSAELAALRRQSDDTAGAPSDRSAGVAVDGVAEPPADVPTPPTGPLPVGPGAQHAEDRPVGHQLGGRAPGRAGGPGRHARRPVPSARRIGGWLHDRLPPPLQGRVALGAGHLTVVALVAAVAFAVTAWWVLQADGSTTLVPSAAQSTSPPAAVEEPLATPVRDEGTAAAGAQASATAMVVVDVAGKVRRPGIVTLPPGSRVVDAVERAGGARRGVDLTSLNLARVLADGEQVLVGISPPGGVAASAASGATSLGPGAAALINVNTATSGQLEELPGVGPVTAGAIIEWRTDNGPFTAVDELLEVSGIGEATLAEIAPHVTL